MPLSPQITITPVEIVTKNFDISAVSYTSSTATYTATGHTFSTGDVVLVSDLAPDGYNGTFTVTATATNTFTVANTTNAAVTDAVGNAFWIDPTEYEYVNQGAAFITDNNDLADPEVNPALAQAQQAINDAATAIANAAAANAAATSAAYTAGVAQTTANGKNTSHYSTSSPSGGGIAGDLWFQVDSGGTVLYQFAYNGSSWISAPISNTVIANLDAGKITAGTITGIAYNNGSGTFSVSPSGVLVASSATITGNITATSGTFTGTVTATSGSFTGTINSSSGTIGGWTLSGTRLFSGTSELNASTGGAVLGGVTVSSLQCNGVINTSSGQSINSGGGLTVQTSITAGSTNLFEFLSSSGNVRVGATYGQTASGRAMQVTSAGLYGTTASTERKKHNITPYSINQDALLKLEPVTFNYLPEIDEEQNPEFGFIAEDADRLGLYELAGYDKDGLPDYFAYEKLSVFLLQVIKNQEARIKALEGE